MHTAMVAPRIPKHLREYLRALGCTYDQRSKEWVDPTGRYYVEEIYVNDWDGVDVRFEPLQEGGGN